MHDKPLQILEGKPEINYPCEWEYRIIGEDIAKIQEAVFEIAPRKYDLQEKNKSSKGRFVSLHLKILVNNEEERNHIFCALKNHKEIKMVI
ncbi:DUF493 domain-containing protein [Helicobacter sp. 13S00482-2]|uniref:HP0495 family protein n=1 Tax=Helicobacter sp. 13S00482-2 TaxID=1476200 RepID=UPI000BA5239E|nr:DUF493 domain-containing protein [Helicobacter sp. 13S00482-2]PAF53072.1 DUF493 domain-containing protein [Helicobacter sp. 13S00482-2]